MDSIPKCLIIPSASGSLSNCITVKMPSLTVLVIFLIITWIIYLLIAYGIYYFLNKQNPSQKTNYWMILGILILSGLIINLLFII